jgi:hypothetical protein
MPPDFLNLKGQIACVSNTYPALPLYKNSIGVRSVEFKSRLTPNGHAKAPENPFFLQTVRLLFPVSLQKAKNPHRF